ncbi:MAG: O-antigen ligase family protein [Cyclobacteriaceae bacterium]|nr:O-antigen ligase family protein [Cyclobacteriaceae bacterium]
MRYLFKHLLNSERVTAINIGIVALALQVGALPFFNITITQITGVTIALVSFYILFKERQISLEVAGLGSIFILSLLWSFIHFDWRGLGRGLDAYYLLFTTPLFISLIKLSSTKIRILLWNFILGTIASYILTLSTAIFYYYSDIMPITGRLTDIFFHEQLGYVILNAHPTYYSLYGCIATLLITFFPSERMWQNLLSVIFITLVISLLMARITLVIQSFLLILFFGRLVLTSLKWRLIVLPLVFLSFIIFYFKTTEIYDYQHRRIFVDFNSSWERSKEPNLTITEWGIVTRFALWRASWEVIEKSPWFGIKPRTEKDALSTQLRLNQQDYIASLKMDSHNYYLSALIAYGFVGVLLLIVAQLLLLWRLGFYAPYLIFTLMIAFVACTEGVFLRFVGTSLFAVIGSLLFFYKKNY